MIYLKIRNLNETYLGKSMFDENFMSCINTKGIK
jgi:hypothetical protein